MTAPAKPPRRGGRRGGAQDLNIVLIGFMGSGKTEVGRRIAERTQRELIDVDQVVEAEGAPISEIFAAEGERGFRRRERRSIERVSRARNSVIATGGGAVLDPANVKALKRSGVLVYLQTGADELVSRLQDDLTRPLLRPAEGPPTRGELRKRVNGLLAERIPLYEGAADHVVKCDGRPPAEVASEIVERLVARAPAAPKRVRVGLTPSYSVHVGRGLLGRVPELVKLPAAAEKACVVSHPRIRRLWGKGIERALKSSGMEVSWWTFPEGEDRKTLDTAGRLSRALARAGLHRDDLVVALGGGVVGDLAGFAASTYNRGVGVIQVPTTLLAMVDAAIGGKTGVNLPQGKNLVGTFHQPLGVVADLDLLATLAERELRGGLAEVIKYGFIAEPGIADTVVREREEIFARGPVLDGLVARCARVKARVVAEDEREAGGRAVLNYGHTLGHAVESMSPDGRSRTGGRLHHGEAISVGMVFAATVAETLGVAEPGLADAHRSVLETVGLPTRLERLDWEDVRQRMKMDKKHKRGTRMVLLEGPGRPVVRAVPDKVLRAALKEVTAR